VGEPATEPFSLGAMHPPQFSDRWIIVLPSIVFSITWLLFGLVAPLVHLASNPDATWINARQHFTDLVVNAGLIFLFLLPFGAIAFAVMRFRRKHLTSSCS
jgi:hypothetical protein